MGPVKKTVCDGKKSQFTKFYKNSVYFDKNCQETLNVHMQPVKPAKESNHMQSGTRSSNMMSIEPETLQSSFKQNNPVKQESMCFDKNCQVNMQPVKPEMDMQSKEPQSSFKKKHVPLCSDKNCQSTRCYQKSEYTKCDKKCQFTQKHCYDYKKCRYTKCLCDDKNCQSANLMWNLKELILYVVHTKGWLQIDCVKVQILCEGTDIGYMV